MMAASPSGDNPPQPACLRQIQTELRMKIEKTALSASTTPFPKSARAD